MLIDSRFMNTDRKEKMRIVLAAIERRKLRQSLDNKDIISLRPGDS
jgi:hypothetical protein